MTGSKRVSTIVPNYNYRWRAVKEYLEGLGSTIRRHLALEKIVPKYNNRWQVMAGAGWHEWYLVRLRYHIINSSRDIGFIYCMYLYTALGRKHRQQNNISFFPLLFLNFKTLGSSRNNLCLFNYHFAYFQTEGTWFESSK